MAAYKLQRLVDIYRRRGHLAAHIDPLQIEENKVRAADPFHKLSDKPEDYGFTKDDLSKPIACKLEGSLFAGKESWTPLEVADKLEQVYTGYIGFEYQHLQSREAIDWVASKIESSSFRKTDKDTRENLIRRIIKS